MTLQITIQLPGCTLWSWSPRPTKRSINSENTIISYHGILNFSSMNIWNNSKCNPFVRFMIKNLKYKYIYRYTFISDHWTGCYIYDFHLLCWYNVDRKMYIIKVSWYFRNKKWKWFGLIGCSASECLLFFKTCFWMSCNIPKQPIQSSETISQHLNNSFRLHIEIFNYYVIIFLK